MNSGRQEHEGESLIARQIELGPQGDGWQTFTGGSFAAIFIEMYYMNNNTFSFILRISVHRTNGSPVSFGRQAHIGL